MGKKRKKPKAQKIIIQQPPAPPAIDKPKGIKAKKGAPTNVVKDEGGISRLMLDPSIDTEAGGIRSSIGAKVIGAGNNLGLSGAPGLSGVKKIADRSENLTEAGNTPQLKKFKPSTANIQGKVKLKDFVKSKNI